MGMQLHPTVENSFKSDRRLISSKAGKATLSVGVAKVVELTSLDEVHKVVFEDDGQTGYFYALDMRKDENPIIGAMHIYDVENVADRNEPSQIHILWSPDGLKAGLWINSYVHAVYNFENNTGCCRTGFSPMSTADCKYEWNDAAIDPFVAKE